MTFSEVTVVDISVCFSFIGFSNKHLLLSNELCSGREEREEPNIWVAVTLILINCEWLSETRLLQIIKLSTLHFQIKQIIVNFTMITDPIIVTLLNPNNTITQS